MSDDSNQEIQLLAKKAQYYFDNSIAVHCKYKSGHWYNGYIQEISSDFFVLNEFEDGETVVFFLELSHMEEYTPKEK